MHTRIKLYICVIKISTGREIVGVFLTVAARTSSLSNKPYVKYRDSLLSSKSTMNSLSRENYFQHGLIPDCQDVRLSHTQPQIFFKL